MDQNAMGKGQPELHNEELEADIRSFTAKQDTELMGKILQKLATAQIMQPADLKKQGWGKLPAHFYKPCAASQGTEIPCGDLRALYPVREGRSKGK